MRPGRHRGQGQRRGRSKGYGSGTPAGTGAFEYLAPTYDLPAGMAYNNSTGLVDGTTIDTTYNAPSTVVTITDQGSRAANRTALNNAITTATTSGSGTRIRVTAGIDFGGQYTLPTNNSSGWVYIETTAVQGGTFIAEGTTPTTSDASLMPQLYQTGPDLPVFTLPSGNAKYRFVGLELAFDPGGTWHNDGSSSHNSQQGLVVGTYEGSTLATYPSDVIVDRCIVRGLSGKNMKRAMFTNGIRIAILNCLFDEVHAGTASGFSDGQCFLATSGPGPYKLHQNMFRCAARGEHVMFGGGSGQITCADIQVTENRFDYPVAWHGTGLDLKNMLEFKIGDRALVQGNVFQNYRSTGVGSQYYATVAKATASNGNGTYCANITFRLNSYENNGGGIIHFQYDEAFLERVEFVCNRQLLPTSDYSGIPRDWCVQLDSVTDVKVKHNTFYCSVRGDANSVSIMLNNSPAAGECDTHEYSDNLFATTATPQVNGYISTDNGQGSGTTAWAYLDGANGIFTGNAHTRTTAIPAGNTTAASIAAANLDASTFEVGSGSFTGVATSGRDPGAVHSLIDTATANVPS